MDIADEVKQILILTEDMLNQAQKLKKTIEDKIMKLGNILTEHDDLTDANRKVELLTQGC